MKYGMTYVVLLCILLTAGCSFFDEGQGPVRQTVQPSPLPAPESKASTIEPAEMALHIFDLPSGYIIKERYDMAYSEISQLERDEGWMKGYYVAFYRMDVKNYDVTGITQRISVYPLTRVSLLFEESKNTVLSRANSSVSVTELPFPKTGDRTIALRTVDSNDPYGIMIYTVIFTKKDVVEQIEMRGTTTDYEVLKDIAQKASDMIR